ncbi:RIP homotypic interaction motif-containing protein [Amycolatopsis rifamycinica]|uniref:Uncharacterized protein n=1 Tax=Amycolatopsis rifamycinica TaxID=287986 RepID=A0A066U3U3_9PSEU|nr:RIP homotypic interaction motif-containing protein [Amycolatopsis rifamycinica]KDN20537.1 hypothetical protein DV20_19170 [Amycolatopsis rifamycinica]
MTDDDIGDGWILEPVPWREICRPVADPDDPLIDASWQGSPVAVVAPHVIEEWVAATQAAVFPTADHHAQVVDVPATLAAEGVTGLLPPNALVVKNCAGIQLGNWNSQTNVHKFRVEDVRITLDKTLARTLAASLPQAESRVAGRTKVALWNSRGVQVGNFNHQHNVFRHVVKGPEIPLRDRAVVDKLREGKLDAVERELRETVRKVFERDAAVLYAALDVTCNENEPAPPEVVEDTIASAYGKGNEQRIREKIDVRALDLSSLTEVLAELEQVPGALKELPEEAVEGPADLELPEPELPPVPPPLPPAVKRTADDGPFRSRF